MSSDDGGGIGRIRFASLSWKGGLREGIKERVWYKIESNKRQGLIGLMVLNIALLNVTNLDREAWSKENLSQERQTSLISLVRNKSINRPDMTGSICAREAVNLKVVQFFEFSLLPFFTQNLYSFDHILLYQIHARQCFITAC